jgi:hypothetical protein
MISIRGFQCCFCINSIEENKVDPVDIKLIFNDDMKNQADTFQLFYAHFNCLNEKLYPPVRDYLLSDNGHIRIRKINRFECCFCTNSIGENKVDPIDINIVFSDDMKNNTGVFYDLYSHFHCLKEKLHKTMQGYLVRDDDDDLNERK